jgi:hypothetical protein
MALKNNRKVALSKKNKDNKQYISIKTLKPRKQNLEIWLKELNFPLLLTKQVFKN